MEYSVGIRLQANRYYSNDIKNIIIFSLPGPYRVNHDALNDLDKGGEHIFIFKNYDPAANFAKDMFYNHSNKFIVRPYFVIKD